MLKQLDFKLKDKEEIMRKHLNSELRSYKSEERLKLNEKYNVNEKRLREKFENSLSNYKIKD